MTVHNGDISISLEVKCTHLIGSPTKCCTESHFSLSSSVVFTGNLLMFSSTPYLYHCQDFLKSAFSAKTDDSPQ